MLTKGHWLIIHLRIKKFRLWFPIPMYVLNELLWQVVELVDLIGWLSRKTREYRKLMPLVMDFLESLGDGGRYDLVDIEADGGDGNVVRIAIKVR